MIILRLQGGMGNQMFQYAAAKSVALRLGVDLALDLGWYHSGTRKQGRVYSLGCFPNLKERVASFRDIFAMAPWQAFENVFERNGLVRALYLRTLFKIFSKAGLSLSGSCLNGSADESLLERIPFSRIHRQKQPYWTPELDALSDGIYMTGYWESEKFFAGHRSEIRGVFEFSPGVLDCPLGREILSGESVSVHVRRGDKLKTSGFLSTGSRYIKEAVFVFLSRLRDPYFFVFSDDIAWCKETLPELCDVRWVFAEGANDKDAYRDLCLMASCRHNIVGTSTFSWWGAWLNPNPGKIVVAPHPSLWFCNLPDGQANLDLLPKDWIVLN